MLIKGSTVIWSAAQVCNTQVKTTMTRRRNICMSASFFQLRLALLLLLRLSEGAGGGGAGGLRGASLLQFSSVTAQLDGEASASPLNSTCRSSDSRPSILVLRLGAALLPFSEHSNNDTKQLTSC